MLRYLPLGKLVNINEIQEIRAEFKEINRSTFLRLTLDFKFNEIYSLNYQVHPSKVSENYNFEDILKEFFIFLKSDRVANFDKKSSNLKLLRVENEVLQS